jgi:hypothetical protein
MVTVNYILAIIPPNKHKNKAGIALNDFTAIRTKPKIWSSPLT